MSGQIERVELSDGESSVRLLSIGCVTQDWQVPHEGAFVPAVLGYDDPESYRANPAYLGAIVGRVANRIANARFELDGQVYQLDANEGPHHLHGGPGALSHRFWQVERDGSRAARFTLHSTHGDGGYPGAVDFAVTISLSGNSLTYDMRATPDRPTPINLAQHNYYALTGGPIHDQHLRLSAATYTPTGPDMIPSGEVAGVEGTAMDFRTSRALRDSITRGGLDHNYVLAPTDGPVATLDAGLSLEVQTDQPGLQVYSATHLPDHATPLPGQTHAPFHALCLEPQGYPNALNTPGFPSIIATPDQPYQQKTTIRVFSRNGA
ncbi:MAG: aldose epimerase family protein [Paracoccaceae bacterium]